MENIKKIADLRKIIQDTDQLVNELVSLLDILKLEIQQKDKNIERLQQGIKDNVEKIDNIIEKYNENS